MPVGDLPGAWNQKYRETLGVTPGNDAEGCLQDIHWSAGLIGYFPTYTLGNVYAAQLYERPGPNWVASMTPSHGAISTVCSAGSARRSTARVSGIVPRP